jgi:hypothetical protein
MQEGIPTLGAMRPMGCICPVPGVECHSVFRIHSRDAANDDDSQSRVRDLVNQAVKGTTDWASYEIPFSLQKGQRPDLIKLNVLVEGRGKVWLRDIQLLKTPMDS